MLWRFWRAESGNFGILTALAALPLLAALAAAVDFTFAVNKANQLQNSLDASGVTIAASYDLGMSDEELTRLGENFYDSNMIGIYAGHTDAFMFEEQQIEDLAASASTDGTDFFITVRSGILHKGIVGSIDWPLHRFAVVKIKRGPAACILALDPTAASAVKFQGSTDLEFLGCVVAANSRSTSAISRGGAAQVRAACTNSVGDTIGIRSNSNVRLDCPAPLEQQYPSFDPLAQVVPPSYTACRSVPGGKKKTLSPGTYCGKTLSGAITLEPGTYILRGGRINLGGNGELKGSGVTIFLMEGAEFTSNGNELVQIEPPSTGPYAGIAVYQEKSNTNKISINGTSDSYVSGFIYAPGAHVFYAGNSLVTTASECLRIVASTIEMTGNSSIRSNCSTELGGREMFASRYLSIVR